MTSCVQGMATTNCTEDGSDFINAGNGNNRVTTGRGEDTVVLGDGNNKVTGNSRREDQIHTGSGNNDIRYLEEVISRYRRWVD